MKDMRSLSLLIAAFVGVADLTSIASAQCQPRLIPGPFKSMNGAVRSAVDFVDGQGGRAVYLGGSFTQANGLATMPVIRWWPTTGAWESVGSPRPSWGTVNDLIVFDDGTGPALYAGLAEGSVQRWTGSDWVALGTSATGTSVADLAIVDLGTGPRLLAGKAWGEQVMVWENAHWTSLASPTSAISSGNVHLIMPAAPRQTDVLINVFGSVIQTVNPMDPASGPAPMSHHLSWNGTSWLDAAASDAALPLAFHPDAVVFDHLTGSGPQLHLITGNSTVYRFDAPTRRWSALPNPPESIQPTGFSVAVFDDGPGPRLYADTSSGLCRYESGAWTSATPPNALVNDFGERWPVDRMLSFRPTPASQPILVVAGHYRIAGSNAVNVSYLTSCAPCLADFDRSGAVGVQDLLSYLQAWFPRDPAAEFDGTPGVDLEDLFAYLAAWHVGCL